MDDDTDRQYKNEIYLSFDIRMDTTCGLIYSGVTFVESK